MRDGQFRTIPLSFFLCAIPTCGWRRSGRTTHRRHQRRAVHSFEHQHLRQEQNSVAGFPPATCSKSMPADREVLEQFVTDKLLEAEVREAGSGVSEDEVDRYIDQVKKNNRLSDDDLKAALSRGESNPGELQSVGQSGDGKKRDHRPPSKTEGHITRRRCRALLQTQHEKLSKPTSARASATFFFAGRKKRRPSGCKASWRKREELYQRIAAGEDFAGLAREYSEGAGQRPRRRYRLGQSRNSDCRPRRSRRSKNCPWAR